MTEASGTPSFREAFEAAQREAAGEPAVEATTEVPSESTEASTETPPATTEEAPPESEAPQTYKVKVDGQEVEVTLEDALAGYQRQADYTRKTQELAADRERLAKAEALVQALNENPQDTLRQLAEAFEVDDFEPVDLDELDPLERDVLETKAFVEQVQQERWEQQVRDEVSRIGQKYGDAELDPIELVQYAVDNEIGNLESAYRDYKFDSLLGEREEVTTTKRAAEDAAAEEAKRAAAVVDGGSSRNASAVTEEDKPVTSVREALFKALKSHGVESLTP